MANITRFDPFNEITRFDPFLDMNDFFKGFGMRPLMREFEREPSIKMDVSEAEGAYMVKAEIPGVNKDDIHISVDGNMVSISAEVKKEKEEKKAKTSYAVSGILARFRAALRSPMRWMQTKCRPSMPTVC